MEALVFFGAAAAALLSAVVVVAHRNPIYSVMSLVVTLLAMAVLFVQLAGHFVAVLLILVYAGAVMVLFLFVIMLLNVGSEPRGLSGTRVQRWSAITGTVIFGLILASLQWGRALERQPITEDDVALLPLARVLFGDYLLPFEMTGLLLLAAVIAATVLARKAPAGPRGGDA